VPLLALRDYQREAVEAVVRAARRGVRRQLVVLPTGAGKTVVAAALSQRARGRILFLAHRDELVQQAEEKFRVVWPEAEVGVVKAERDEIDGRVVVASLQTLARPERRARLPASAFTLVILDEAHHGAAATPRRVLEDLGLLPEPQPGRLLLGLTATPFRTDGAPLGALFQAVTYRRSIAELIRAGYLADVRGIRVDTALDLSHVRVHHGDYDERDLSLAIDTPGRNRLAVEAWRTYGEGRRTVAFTVTVAHAQHLADAFREAGIPADWVSGELPAAERRRRLARLRAGEIQVLTNAQLLTEGWDEPSVACILMSRPTRSKAAYVQAVGRGLRPFPGKADCLVLDLADNAQDLVTFASLEREGVFPSHRSRPAAGSRPPEPEPAEPPPEVEGAALRATPLDLLGRSAFRWHLQRHRLELEAGPGRTIVLEEVGSDLWQVTLVGAGVREPLHDRPLPLAYAQGVAEDWVRAQHLERYADRQAAWRRRPATARQLDVLRRLGVTPEAGITREEAADRIRAALRRRILEDPEAPWRREPASPRQIAWLRARGLPVPEGLTKGGFAELLRAWRQRGARAE
jgi:superfamily II DNA or RNA helicase